MKTMWNVAKIKAMEPEVSRQIDEWTILQAATIGGAKSLFLDKVTGSLEVGKEADITLVAKNELGMAPIRPKKLVALLIYSASPRNVKYVLSDGVLRVENGKLKIQSEANLANDLTNIANLADRRRDTGKTWRQKDTLTTKSLPYWYRYRSLRTADEMDVRLLNATDVPLTVTIASSAATFGGGSPYVADKEVTDRFPDQPSGTAFDETTILQPGQTLSVSKQKGAQPFLINYQGHTKSHDFKAGQLMILCEQATSPHATSESRPVSLGLQVE